MQSLAICRRRPSDRTVASGVMQQTLPLPNVSPWWNAISGRRTLRRAKVRRPVIKVAPRHEIKSPPWYKSPPSRNAVKYTVLGYMHHRNMPVGLCRSWPLLWCRQFLQRLTSDDPEGPYNAPCFTLRGTTPAVVFNLDTHALRWIERRWTHAISSRNSQFLKVYGCVWYSLGFPTYRA